MFERFTADAREVVVGAQGAARRRRERIIGTEHLLMALLAQRHTASSDVLARHGLTADAVDEAATRLTGGTDELDAAALGSLGIDLDAVREKVEATFGRGALDRERGTPRGHIPFSKRAKKVLELSLREAVRLRHKEIGDAHVLLGILREGEGLAMRIVADAGVDVAVLRGDLEFAIAARAS